MTTSGEYENSSKSAIEQTPGVSAVEAGAKTEAAMEVDIHEEVGEDSAEGMRSITDRIAVRPSLPLRLPPFRAPPSFSGVKYLVLIRTNSY